MLPAVASTPAAIAEGGLRSGESAEAKHWRVLDEQAENARARLLAPDNEPLLVHVDADRDRDRDRVQQADGARGRPTVRAEASPPQQPGQPGQPGRRRQHSNEAGPFSTRAAGGSRALGGESGVGDVGEAQLREWEHRGREWSPDQTWHGWRDWSPGEGRVR